jgi:hypothetical protein
VTTIDLKHVLLWCVGLNYAVLFIWFAVFVFAHDWMFRMHGRWFKLSVETFDAIHYAGLSVYKIGIILFNLVPRSRSTWFRDRSRLSHLNSRSSATTWVAAYFERGETSNRPNPGFGGGSDAYASEWKR